MASLALLPDECILSIISEIPSTHLPSVALISQSFHRCSIRRLYTFIYYWEPGLRGYTYPLVCPEWSHSSKDGQRIYDLENLIRTIEEVPSLRSQIAAASFDWQSRSGSSQDLITQLIKLLPLSVKIHISPIAIPSSLAPASRPAQLEPWNLPRIAAIDVHLTTIEMGMARPGFLQPQTHGHQLSSSFARRPQLQSLFSHSGLHQVAISGSRCWRFFEPTSAMVQNRVRPRSSRVTAILLTNTVPMDMDLVEVLTWPEALEIFHMETRVSEASTNFGSLTRIMSPVALMSAVSIHKDSLVELYISSSSDDRGSDGSALGSFQSFRSLKRLGIPVEFCGGNIPQESGFVTSQTARLQLTGSPPELPTSLEELQLEVECSFNWFQPSSSQPKDNVSSEATILLEMLASVESSISTMPKIKRIALWQRRMSCSGASVRLQRRGKGDINKDLKFMPTHFENLAAIRKMLRIVRDDFPPLFGHRERLQSGGPQEAWWFASSGFHYSSLV